jgi:hypothetical protein
MVMRKNVAFFIMKVAHPCYRSMERQQKAPQKIDKMDRILSKGEEQTYENL